MSNLRRHLFAFSLLFLFLLAAMAAGATVNAQGEGIGSLTVVKEALPADGADFTFTTDAPAPAVFLRQWGNVTGDAQFDGPAGVAVGAGGNVYVVDTFKDRVQVFTNNGDLVDIWGGQDQSGINYFEPFGIAVGGTGNVYIADTFNALVRVHDADGNYLGHLGSFGTGDGKFDRLFGVAVGGDDNVYVADTFNNRIQVLDTNGNYLRQWGGTGAADGQFNRPFGLALDGDDNVYVLDTNNQRLQVFDSEGNFLRKWGSAGSGEGQFGSPRGITVDGDGNVYVADGNNHRVQVFDSDGNFLYAWGSEGSGEGQFGFPQGIAIDAAGAVYVSDRDNNRIQVFKNGFLLDDATPDDGDDVPSSYTLDNLAAGSYTVSEILRDGWQLNDVSCDGGDWSADLENASVTVNLQGEDVTCTFSNGAAPVNNAPTALDDSFTVPEDTVGALLDVLQNDSDPDEDDLLISEIDPLSAGGEAVNNGTTITYTSFANFLGTETFTYTVSDGNGGEATATVTVLVNKVDIAALHQFVALGLEGVWLQDNSSILSGDVGANVASDGPFLSNGTEVTVGSNVRLHDPTSRVFGDSIFLNKNATVYDVYYNELDGSRAVNGAHHSPLTLPVLTNVPEAPVFIPGTADVSVAKNRSVTLDAGDYGALGVGSNGTLVLSGGLYNFASWDVRKNAKITFLASSEVRIAGRLAFEDNVYVGPAAAAADLSGADLVIVVLGENGVSGKIDTYPAAAVIGKNTHVYASLYVPNGTLQALSNAQVSGALIGKWVVVGRNVTLMLDSGL